MLENDQMNVNPDETGNMQEQPDAAPATKESTDCPVQTELKSTFIDEQPAVPENSVTTDAGASASYADPYRQPDVFKPVQNYSPVNYTPVKSKQPVSKGVKVFSVIMAAVILLTVACSAGYLIGKNGGTSLKNLYSDTTLNLQGKPADTDEYSAVQVYDIVNKSVVGITTYDASGNGSVASGIVYTEDGYIITNDHIYSEIPSAKFLVTTSDGKEYDAIFVAGDTRSDLAVLKIDTDGLYPAVFGNPEELSVGENVVAVGRPDGIMTNSMTRGIISLKQRRVKINTSYSMKLIQTDTAINPGNSGGALVNMYGQIVGITSSKIVDEKCEGICFAIPTTTVKSVVESLIKNGNVNFRSRLGITYHAITAVEKSLKNLPYGGIVVSEVSNDSPLYGKVKQNDIITTVNGIEIVSDDVILDVIENTKPGETIELGVYSDDGTAKSVTAALLADPGTSSYVSDLQQ